VAEARAHLERARELTENAPDTIRRARILDDLSDALSRLGENVYVAVLAAGSTADRLDRHDSRGDRGVPWRLR
jgi:hypothetical protein